MVVAAPESIATNVLSDRLQRLVEAGVVVQSPAAEGGKHLAYHLTPKGEALRPVLLALKQWGLAWQEGSQVLLSPKAAGRRKSFCARMSGMKAKLTGEKAKKDPNSRINKSLRAWNC